MRYTSIKHMVLIFFLTGMIFSTNTNAWWTDSTEVQWSSRNGTFNTSRNYQPQQLRIVKGHDFSNYYLYIELAGLQPEEIDIQRQGPRLMIRQIRGRLEENESDYSYRSYESFSSFTRRLMLPLNADPDPSKMIRENKENFIRLTIPKQAVQFGNQPL